MSRRTFGSAQRWPRNPVHPDPVRPDPADVRLRTRAAGPADAPLV